MENLRGLFLEVKVRLAQRVQPLAQPKDFTGGKTKKFEEFIVRIDSLMNESNPKSYNKKIRKYYHRKSEPS